MFGDRAVARLRESDDSPPVILLLCPKCSIKNAHLLQGGTGKICSECSTAFQILNYLYKD